VFAQPTLGKTVTEPNVSRLFVLLGRYWFPQYGKRTLSKGGRGEAGDATMEKELRQALL
jgi:hypothetical protein